MALKCEAGKCDLNLRERLVKGTPEIPDHRMQEKEVNEKNVHGERNLAVAVAMAEVQEVAEVEAVVEMELEEVIKEGICELGNK